MPLNTATFSLTGSGTLTKTLTLSTPTDTIQIGAGAFPAATFDLADGNGDAQAQDWYSAFLTIRAIILVIKDPTSAKRLRVGPQNVTNAAQLGFGGVGAQAYLEFDRFAILERIYTGWTVTPGTGDLLPINNPSGVSVDVAVWVLGTTS
jgi:hypothetical protein